MQVKLLPEEQKNIFNSEMENAISHERQKSNETINDIRKSLPKKTDTEVAWVFGGFVGLVIGVFPCYSVGESLNHAGQFGKGVGMALLTWLVCAIVGAIIGNMIGKSMNSSHEESVNSHNRSQQAENNRLQKKIEEINSTYQKKYENYVKNFELTAQQESVKFAESRLAKEVIEWMTDGFSKTIDSTDRRSHIERINVPFAFNVYTNKITCNLGTYDFEIKRCSNLTSPIEQTALARAIASAIQLNIVMKYPQDESGTSISINIDYNYSTECPITIITYVAPNGNYRAVEKW